MILMYHKVAATVPTIWWVSADTFDRQLAALQAYRVVYLDDYDPNDPTQVVITFDGIYKNVLQFAAPLLKKWKYPFELFVIADQIGKGNEFDRSVEPSADFASLTDLNQLVGMGARIQWHTRSHRELRGMPRDQLVEELTPSRELRDSFGQEHLRWFAYPHGEYDTLLVEEVRARFAGAVACNESSSHDRYLLPRVTVTEQSNLSRSKVSIVVANYNYGRFLPEALDSVFSQSVPPDDFLIIDDCSTDDSRRILDTYRDRVRIVENERNLGIVENFKKAVSLTTGDYIGFLGADNRMRSDYVERCKATLDRNPRAGVAYTDMTIFGPLASVLAGKVNAERVYTSPVDGGETYLWQFPEPTPEALATIKEKNFIHGSSMYRREAYDRVGGYRRSDGPEDHDLFVRMLNADWKAVHVPEAVIEYRQHSSAQANTMLALQLHNLALSTQMQKIQMEAEEGVARIRRELAETHENWEARGVEIQRLVEVESTLRSIESTLRGEVGELRAALSDQCNAVSTAHENWRLRGLEVERLAYLELELRAQLKESERIAAQAREATSTDYTTLGASNSAMAGLQSGDPEQSKAEQRALIERLQTDVATLRGRCAELATRASLVVDGVTLPRILSCAASLIAKRHEIPNLDGVIRYAWAESDERFKWIKTRVKGLIESRFIRGKDALVADSGLFDEEFYREQVSDSALGGLQPELHFVLTAIESGASPHPLFEPSYYLKTNPDVARAGVNPFLHYIESGWRERRSPHPLFDVSFYLSQPGVPFEEPLKHFLASKPGEYRHPNRLFDPDYYLRAHPDVAAIGLNPLVHFVRWGAMEWRRCHLMFDTAYYMNRYADVGAAKINPLVHYFLHGKHEGRLPSQDFVPDLFLDTTPIEPLPRLVLSRRAKVKKLPLFLVYGKGHLPFLKNILIPTLGAHKSEREVELHLVNYADNVAHFGGITEAGGVRIHDWSASRPAQHMGFGDGHNFLFQRVQPPECFVLVNPDSSPMAGCLDKLCTTYERTSAGIVEARQWPKPHPKEYDPKYGDTPWASGAFSLIDSAGFAEIHGFDPIYVLYGEDVDLSWRFWLSGRRVIHEPQALCSHFTGMYSYRSDRFYHEHFWSTRNFLVLARKFFGDKGEAYGLRVLEASGFPIDFKKKVLEAYEKVKPVIVEIGPVSHPAIKILNMNIFHFYQSPMSDEGLAFDDAQCEESIAHAS